MIRAAKAKGIIKQEQLSNTVRNYRAQVDPVNKRALFSCN
jgi:hypothetical protein